MLNNPARAHVRADLEMIYDLEEAASETNGKRTSFVGMCLCVCAVRARAMKENR